MTYRSPAGKIGVGPAVNRKLNIAAIVMYVCLTVLILYVAFPMAVVNALVSDIVTVLLFSAIISLLVYGSLKIHNLSDLAKFLPAAMVMVFLIRAIPNIILHYPPLSDPYFHYICTLNVLEYGTVQSQVTWWYGLAPMQLSWPMMHILTAQLVEMTGLDPMFFFRFFAPLMGLAFFLGLFSLAQLFLKNYGMSLLAALIGSMGSTVIFFQSEYHPQGLALTLFIFILICFFKTRGRSDAPLIIISLVFILAFVFTHHFSTLFLSLIFLAFFMLGFIASKLPILKGRFGFLWGDSRFLLPVAVVILIFCIYTNPDLVKLLFSWSFDLKPGSGLTTATEQLAVPVLTTILNGFKWIPVIMVVLTAPFILKHGDNNQTRLLALVSLIFAVGFMGLFLFFLPLDRLLALSMPIIGIICAYALLQLSRSKKKFKNIVLASCAFALTFAMIAGMFASQMPAYFFRSPGTDPYYWYGNDLPQAVEMEQSGLWSIENIERNSTYGITFATWSIPFYYGQNPIGSIGGIDLDRHYDFIVVNENVYYEAKKSLAQIGMEANKVYSGPNIVYYYYSN